MSNLTSASGEASVSSGNKTETSGTNFNIHHHYFAPQSQQPNPHKRKRNQAGNPDPDAEVIALSPRTLMATNRFVCEVCNKGFQRDQNLQLHKRGHNLPWKLKQRENKDVMKKKVYVCPEASCVHHDPLRALGDLTGIKKHFSRKHGEKKWKCEKCSKRYAVQSDWKAHSKTCGTKEYRCDCGTLFSRRDSFITHRAFCDALAEESARTIISTPPNPLFITSSHNPRPFDANINAQTPSQSHNDIIHLKKEQSQSHQLYSVLAVNGHHQIPPWLNPSQPSIFSHQQTHQNPNSIGLPHSDLFHASPPAAHMSATALLQKAAQMGSTMSHQTEGRHVASPGGTAGVFGLTGGENGPATTFPEYMMNSESGFDETFGGFFTTATDSRRINGGGGGDGQLGEGLTRDFLGLRTLSRNDFLSFAEMGNGIGPTHSHEIGNDQQHNQQPADTESITRLDNI